MSLFNARRVLMKFVRMLALCAAFALPSAAMAADNSLMMATTTSTQDSGLLEFLQPTFKAETGIDLKWVAVGTGKALEHGKNCDVDVLLVHAPGAEKEFVKAGHGIDRRQVMYKDFVIVGPKADPAGIKGKSTAEALKTLADKKAVFVSRGDKSGTHKAEQKLWKSLNMPLPDKESWYVSAGQGMMPTLNVALEKNGYTMTDRGTWIKFDAVQKGKNPLAIVVEGDKALFNQYSVITVNPAQCPKVRKALAAKFEDWWVHPKTQKRIAEYTLEGKQLFFPNAENAVAPAKAQPKK